MRILSTIALALFTATSAAQAAPTSGPADLMREALATAQGVSTGQMQHLATGRFLDDMGDYLKIDPACIADHMNRAGLPGPTHMEYVDSTRYAGGPVLHDATYYFDVPKFGPVYGRFFIRLGPTTGPTLHLWSIEHQKTSRGEDIPTLLHIRLRGNGFTVDDLPFDTADPLAIRETEYRNRFSPIGRAVFTPDGA